MSSAAAQTSQGQLRYPPLTFGVEFEFVAPYLYDGETDDLAFIQGLPPCSRVKNGATHKEAEEQIMLAIQRVFEEHGLGVGPQPHKYETPFAEEVLGKFSGWGIACNRSIAGPTFAKFGRFENYKVAWLEIQTPVEPDDAEAFEALEHARKLLVSRFRTCTNPSCSLNVQVGWGAERFAVYHLRRIAALIWATEHLLVKLSHPYRLVNSQCRRIRHTSILSAMANGLQMLPVHAVDIPCLTYAAADYTSAFQKSSPGPANAASDEPVKAFRTRTLPRIVNTPYTAAQLEAMADQLRPDGGDVLEMDAHSYADPGVFEGVRRILECRSSCEITQLISHLSDMAVHLPYSCFDLRDKLGRRAVEFRSAEGCHTPWMKTWAKICVGLVRFAVTAPADALFAVLARCNKSMREEGVYDVIDLLDDLGLPAEAAAAEERIRAYAKAWGIEFVATEDQAS
ncbi:hypothetical protein GGR52DRAFT_382334 [Hypoxylon sp. FL1284]|nr:hypothetical protein GGR52DRAFT_382334 [Hypoxylon sp. FL1284]